VKSAPIHSIQGSRSAARTRTIRLMLECAECLVKSTGNARGWRALLGLEDDDTETVVVLCPECAEREFGEERHGDSSYSVDWD
jgi:hypothetical protein